MEDPGTCNIMFWTQSQLVENGSTWFTIQSVWPSVCAHRLSRVMDMNTSIFISEESISVLVCVLVIPSQLLCQLFRHSFSCLDRWSDLAPDQPRPRAEGPSKLLPRQIMETFHIFHVMTICYIYL